jgi:hypothetical protein
MSQEPHREHSEGDNPFARPSEQRKSWLDRRRDKIVAEIEANRRGEYKVPTWVLVVALVAMLVVICGVLIFA